MSRLYYNKRCKRMRIENLLNQVKQVLADTVAKANERALEFPCEAGTLNDCVEHLQDAVISLTAARNQLA